jgi:hypothetical protein
MAHHAAPADIAIAQHIGPEAVARMRLDLGEHRQRGVNVQVGQPHQHAQ